MANPHWPNATPQHRGARHPAGQDGPQWQQPAHAAGWQHQGAWHRQPEPPKAVREKKILGILLGVCLAALAGFVAVLLFVDREPGYDYDDYEAPPVSDTAPDQLVVAKSEEEAWQILRDNPSYAGVLPDSVNCKITAIEHNGMSPEEIEARLNDLTACLMKVWDRPMTEQGITMFRPSVTVYTADITTGCGTTPGDAPNAFYCSADQMLYYNFILHTHPRTKSVGDTPWGIEAVMAHEFAHFLQGRTGIMGAFALVLGSDANSEPALNASRRSELQADCWAGMWTRANQRAAGVDEAGHLGLAAIFGALGGDTHGSAEHRSGWYLKGTHSTSIGTCNTWVVPDDEVS
ncbi:neutral zinc metallopeptidase [Enemella sp. A6]|uniref:neutral zinc metallopeptidase n=1 Tax=Enemella sp. A6 TaxID=3440152 RepID=UPI003EC1036C